MFGVNYGQKITRQKIMKEIATLKQEMNMKIKRLQEKLEKLEKIQKFQAAGKVQQHVQILKQPIRDYKIQNYQNSGKIQVIVKDQRTQQKFSFDIDKSLNLAIFRKLVQRQLKNDKFRFWLGQNALAKHLEQTKQVFQILKGDLITIRSGQTGMELYNAIIKQQQNSLNKKQQKPIENQLLKPKHPGTKIEVQKVSKLQHPYPYLLQIFQTQLSIQKNYRKFSTHQIDTTRRLRNFILSENGIFFNHSLIKLNLNAFFGYDWGRVQNLVLQDCSLSDLGFQMLVKNAANFTNLKILCLHRNNITKIQIDHVSAFKSLRLLKIDQQFQSSPNPLTLTSKQQMDSLAYKFLPDYRRVTIFRKK